MRSFSNQQEGEPNLYHVFEKSTAVFMESLEYCQKVEVLKIFFNTKHGAKKFIIKLLKTISDDVSAFEKNLGLENGDESINGKKMNYPKCVNMIQ